MTENEARRLLYRFLAQCYNYPGATFSRILCRSDIWDWVAEAGHWLSGQANQCIGDLQGCAAYAQGNDQKLLADLQAEYAYLFVNLPRRRAAKSRCSVLAPPYESAYTGIVLLADDPVSAVVSAYRQGGLAIRDDYDAPPDHVAAQLEFMAYLIRQETRAAQQDGTKVGLWQERQREFLASHLLRWGPPFLASVRTHARRAFYVQVAAITSVLLAAEESRFGLV